MFVNISADFVGYFDNYWPTSWHIPYESHYKETKGLCIQI